MSFMFDTKKKKRFSRDLSLNRTNFKFEGDELSRWKLEKQKRSL